MAYQVNLTRRALRDLAFLYRHIEAETSLSARQWFLGLEKYIYSLEHYPRRAAVTPEDKTLRHLLYGKKPHVYRVIFEIEEDSHTVHVLHIRHGARDKLPKRR